MNPYESQESVPAELLIATLATYKATRGISGRRDIIAAYALHRIFSEVRYAEIIRVQISVTPKNKKRAPKDWTRYAVLLDKVWLLDPVLDDLNDKGSKFLPEIMIVPMTKGSRAAHTDFRRFHILYGLCSDKRPDNFDESKEARWIPVAEYVFDELLQASRDDQNRRF